MLTESQQARLAIWYEVNASLSAYNKLIKAFFHNDFQTIASDNQLSTVRAWQSSSKVWSNLGIHAKHCQRHEKKTDTLTFLKQVEAAIVQERYQLIFSDEDAYPRQLHQLFDPPPLLFARGNIARLQEAQIAIVGSRKPTPHAQKISFDMAQYLAESGYIVTSGLAQGVDYQAHLGALSVATHTVPTGQTHMFAKGRTIGVMGTGIDVCYPRHHNTLFHQIVEEGGCLISELLPNTPANKHTFPRRNRLVAGLSLGTIVTEAAIKSGSLITARLTSEQGKQVFAVPSHIDNMNAEGCHHLIREGATLIYHPEQVLEDLKFQQMQPTITHQSANDLHPVSVSANVTVNSHVSHETYKQIQQTELNKPYHEGVSDISVKEQTLANLDQNKALPLPSIEVPENLSKLFAQIDWSGTEVDTLVEIFQIPTHQLLGQLMELELMGLIMQQGGRYVRV